MREKKGFTLIEVIISLLIFGLVLVLVMSLLMSSLGIHKKALDTSKNTMDGSKNMAEKIEGVSVTKVMSDQIIDLDFTQSGGGHVKIKGDYFKDRSDKTKFQYFEPTGYEHE